MSSTPPSMPVNASSPTPPPYARSASNSSIKSTASNGSWAPPLQPLMVTNDELELLLRLRQRNTGVWQPRRHEVEVTPKELEILTSRRQPQSFEYAQQSSLSNANTSNSELSSLPDWAIAPVSGRPGPYANSSLEASTSLMVMKNLHIPAEDQSWCLAVNSAVREIHSKIDNSHNYEHIQRVCAIALKLFEAEKAAGRATNVDPRKLFVAMMVHDVGDSKYVTSKADGESGTKNLLIRRGCPTTLVDDIWTIANGVSFSQEQKDPQKVRDLIIAHPELAFVQDADRLDGLGALGVGRCFGYGGHAENLKYKSLDRAVQMIWQRFRLYLGSMKTQAGREEAYARWPEMELFWKQYAKEADVSAVLIPNLAFEDDEVCIQKCKDLDGNEESSL